MDLTVYLNQMQAGYIQKPQKALRLPRPIWLRSDDPMAAIYHEKETLLQHGNVFFAHIVQANSILFHLFPHQDAPAHIVYSTDPAILDHSGVLREVARNLFCWKNKPPETIPPQWRDIARVITDEYDRSEFTFHYDCNGNEIEFHMIPTMIFRKLLPGRTLRGGFLPILTAPDCKSVLILPKQYWSVEFKALWSKGML